MKDPKSSGRGYSMSLIKLKRGLKSNLPLLESGEPALVTDTGELFIGDGTENLNFTPINPNLITNGNFQIAMSDMDCGQEVKIAEEGINYYVFGNFFIKSLEGNVYMSRPPAGSRLRIRCENAVVEFGYFESPCVYNAAANNYEYITAFKSQEVTLSYLVSNQTGSSFQTMHGMGEQKRTIPVGKSRIAITYTLKESIMSVFLHLTQPITGIVEIGEAKLEIGKRATPFFPNSIAQDFAVLSQYYRTYSLYLRPGVITSNELFFYFPIDVANGMKSNVLPILNCIKIIDIAGVVQDGFDTTISIDKTNQPGTILLPGILCCVKANHGLKEAGALVDYILDMRG